MMMGTSTYNSISSSSSRGDMNMDMDMDMMNMKPAWLERLMDETFFGDCGVHKNRRKNEKNIFCLHCCLSICPHCLSSHTSHPLLQVLYYIIPYTINFTQFFSYIINNSFLNSIHFLQL